MTERKSVTRARLAQLLDDHLPRMAFHQYGQGYNDDPDFDIEAYYDRVASAIFDALPATPAASGDVEAAWEALYADLLESVDRGNWPDDVFARHRPRIEAAIERRTLTRHALRQAGRPESAGAPCQYCGSVNGATPLNVFHTDPMTGDTLRASIAAATDLIDPRLSEVDWDAVASVFDEPESAGALDAERLARALRNLAPIVYEALPDIARESAEALAAEYERLGAR